VRSTSPAATTPRETTAPVRAQRGAAWRSRLRRAVPLAAVIAALVPAVVAALVIVAQHPTVVLGGDFAFIEQSVVDAEHGRQLLGAFDRFGFAHLGPAHYYLLAPVYWALGNPSYALAVGSLMLAGLAGAAVVAVGARRGGAGVALPTALLVILYLHSVGEERLRDPWGPWAITVPTLLLLSLVAAFAAGSTPALLGALLTATFIAQTHISTPPTLAAILVVAAVLRRLTRGRGPAWPSPAGRRRHALLVAGLCVLLAAAWVPPVVQQVTGHPGNLTLVYRYFRHPHGGFDGTGFPPTIRPASQSLADAVSGLGLELSVFPTGRPSALLNGVHTPAVLPEAGRFLLVAGYASLAILLAVVAWRRQDRFALTLGLATLTAMATAVVSSTHIAGEFYDYLIAWTTALPVALWLGWAALAAGWVREWRGGSAGRLRPLLAGTLAALVAAAGGAETAALAGLPPLSAMATPQGPDPTLAPAAALVRGDLARSGSPPALLRIADPDTWPLVAAVGDQLRRHRQPVAVAGAWVSMFGAAYRPTGAERVEYTFADAATTAAPPPGDERLGRVGDVVVDRRSLAG
jgi:hypothetical protein